MKLCHAQSAYMLGEKGRDWHYVNVSQDPGDDEGGTGTTEMSVRILEMMREGGTGTT